MTQAPCLDIVILGLSITSSWGNGHATTYRALVRELVRRGHSVTFLERDVPWYAAHRDLADPPYGRTILYGGLAELKQRWTPLVREADVVIVGSYVPEGVPVAHWVLDHARGVTGFYDIDTPVTLAKLEAGDEEYLTAALIPRFDLYLSFTGGPILDRLERRYGARSAQPLYCSVDPEIYRPSPEPIRWDLGYLGTYSPDRQPKLDSLLAEPARLWREGQFVVAGPQYPADISWPANVERIEHLPPPEHASFYNAQRFTLNVTRDAMVAAGWSPSVRLFEAAACGVPIVSDWWEGLDSLFAPGEEILVARSGPEVVAILRDTPEARAREIGEAARRRVLAEHTAAHRAEALESLALEARQRAKTLLGT
jgi:spore maturation protein CgeB